ncbi:MAG TPA: hypothetical protein VNW15_00515 [Rhizomicrobium sp.]|nr:hypothetical protein [Rhizomicrobium sp.]
MGKFVGGLLIGIAIGAFFSQSLFADGFGGGVQRWIEQTFGF